MKGKIKIIILLITILFISVVGFLAYGLYLMGIEDIYGEHQNLHFKSKTEDLIINKSTYEFGIIEKTWNRTTIRTIEKNSTDLFSWIYKTGVKTKAEIDRPKKGEIKLNEISYSKLLEKIKDSKLKLIVKN